MKRQFSARSPECDSPDAEQCVPDKQRRAKIAVHLTEDSDDAEDCTDSAYVSYETVIETSPTDELDGCMGSAHRHRFKHFEFSNKIVSEWWNQYNFKPNDIIWMISNMKISHWSRESVQYQFECIFSSTCTFSLVVGCNSYRRWEFLWNKKIGALVRLSDWIFDGDVFNKSVIQFIEPVQSANRLFHKKCQKCVAISQGQVTLKPMQEADVINVFMYRGKEDNGFNAGKDVCVFAFTDPGDQYLCVQGTYSIHVQNRPPAVNTSRQAVPTQTDSRYFYHKMLLDTDYCVFESTERQNYYLAATAKGGNAEVSLKQVNEDDIRKDPDIQFIVYPA